MAQVERGGVLAITIDLELDIDEQTRSDGRELETVTRRLIAIFEHFRVPATWGVADPAISAATEVILAGAVRHEMGLLGDRTWVGRSAGRTRLARELARRTAAARAVGLPATSLLLRRVALEEHFDLLIKNGITVVRSREVDVRNRREIGHLDPLCYGVWQMPNGGSLPGKRSWLPCRGADSAACRAIERAIQTDGTTHLAIDGPALIATHANYACVERVVEFAARRRDANLLRLATLGELAEELNQRPASHPSRSVLCGAA